MRRLGQAKRALIVVQNLPVPFDRRVWSEATSLTAAGYAVSVISPKMKGYTKSFESLEGVDIYRYPLPMDARGAIGFAMEFIWCFTMTLLLSLRVAIFGRGFDVIHACNPPEIYWPLAWLWRPFGKRFIFDHHDLSPEMYRAKFEGKTGRLYKGLLFLERMTFRTADVVLSTNESYRSVAMERGKVDPANIFIVRSGPDSRRFRHYPADPEWKKGQAHLIVYLGEIGEQDGVDHLVRALKELRQKRRDFHCVLVGGGPHQPAIKAYADELGLGDCCTFTGRIGDDELLCRILSSADVAVVPDTKNDWSDKSTMNKVMEYMFFGLPMVSYDLTETRVTAGEAAVYAEADCEPAFAMALDELINDPAKRQRMGAFGQQRLEAELAWEHSVPRLLAAYEQALGGRARGLNKGAHGGNAALTP